MPADARLTVYGDVASGYIFAPHPPVHSARSTRDRVSPMRAVRFEDRSVDSATARLAPLLRSRSTARPADGC